MLRKKRMSSVMVRCGKVCLVWYTYRQRTDAQAVVVVSTEAPVYQRAAVYLGHRTMGAADRQSQAAHEFEGQAVRGHCSICVSVSVPTTAALIQSRCDWLAVV